MGDAPPADETPQLQMQFWFSRDEFAEPPAFQERSQRPNVPSSNQRPHLDNRQAGVSVKWDASGPSRLPKLRQHVHSGVRVLTQRRPGEQPSPVTDMPVVVLADAEIVGMTRAGGAWLRTLFIETSIARLAAGRTWVMVCIGSYHWRQGSLSRSIHVVFAGFDGLPSTHYHCTLAMWKTENATVVAGNDRYRPSFPGVHARVREPHLARGRRLARLGENGAGKSTLIKVLSGAHRPDAGAIRIHGQPLLLDSPQRAQHAGIAVIYQEFNLVPALSARENIFLGQESTWAGFISRNYEIKRVRDVLHRLGATFDPETPCRELTIAQQQLVEIARALLRQARILVMDEPSAPLTSQEVERLFSIIRDLKSQGIGIIYVSHRLDEIFVIADRVQVRATRNAGEFMPMTATRRLIERMVGRQLRRVSCTLGEARQTETGRARIARSMAVRDVSFTIHAGEVRATGLIARAGLRRYGSSSRGSGGAATSFSMAPLDD